MAAVQQFSMFGQPVPRGEVTFSTPTARVSDIITSHEAAKLISLNADSDRMLVLSLLCAHDNLTDFEIARLSDREQTSLGVRRGELVKAGLAEMATYLDGDEVVIIKRPSRPGKKARATAWRATPTGRAYYKENNG